VRVALPVVALAGLLTACDVMADDIGGWARDHAEDAWKTVRGDLDDPARSSDVSWTARIMATDGWSTTAELLVVRPWNGPGTVRYARTIEWALVPQLEAVRQASPRIGLAEATARLKVRRGALDSATCPAAIALAERLPDVDIAALPANEVTVDAPSYEVTLTPAYRSARRFEVDMGENDLARWCEEILAAVVACEGVPPRQ
jgi:hypothetical protein